MDISDNGNPFNQYSEILNYSDWVTVSSNSYTWSDDEDTVDSIFESKDERDHVSIRLNCGKQLLDKLIKSNDLKDKETLDSTVIKILKNDYDVDLQYLISNLTLDLYANDYEGVTALSLAASFISIKVVKLLLQHMTDSDVDRYNQENLLSLYPLTLLPNLWLVEHTLAIVDLIQNKNIQFNLKNKLIVLNFLVHDVDDCKCQDTSIDRTELSNNLDRLITYGSSIHIKKVIHKIRNDISSGKLKLDMSHFYIEVSRALSPGIVFKIYIDEDVKELIEQDLRKSFEEDIGECYLFEYNHYVELKWMEIMKLKNNLSFHELLKKHPHDIYDHVKNLDIFYISHRFTIAGGYIRGLKAKSLIRHQVLQFIPDFVETLLPPLPDLCFDKIIFYITGLSNEDLLNICKAVVLKNDVED